MGLWPKFSDLYVLKELDFWVKIQKSLVINATNLYDIQAQQQFLCQKWFWLSLSTFAMEFVTNYVDIYSKIKLVNTPSKILLPYVFIEYRDRILWKRIMFIEQKPQASDNHS